MSAMLNPPVLCQLIGHTIDAGRLQLKLTAILGEGGYGVVYRAVEQHHVAASTKRAPKQYAVKVLEKADEATVEGECQSREMVAHKIVSEHPNVLTLHHIIEDDWFIYLVLDYCPGGDLYSAIVERHTYCQNDALTKSVFVQILDAVQSCHDKGIYHRDLKPDNIFISSDDSKVLLGDFGLATDDEMSSSFSCGSLFYMSPECIGEEFGFAPYSAPASDVWALGIILTNMIAGRNPWRHATTNDAHFHHHLSNKRFFREMLPISEAAADLLNKILTFNASDRITIPELRKEVLSIKTFYLTKGEVASATKTIKSAAVQYSPRPASVKVLPKVEIKPKVEVKEDDIGVSIFLQDDPDDLEYIFRSPDPDAPIYCPPPSSALSTTTTLFEDGESLFDELSPCSSQDSSAPVTPADTLVEDPMDLGTVKDLEGDEDDVVPSWSIKDRIAAFVRPSFRMMGLQAS